MIFVEASAFFAIIAREPDDRDYDPLTPASGLRTAAASNGPPEMALRRAASLAGLEDAKLRAETAENERAAATERAAAAETKATAAETRATWYATAWRKHKEVTAAAEAKIKAVNEAQCIRGFAIRLLVGELIR